MILAVRVIVNASRTGFGGMRGDEIVLRVRAPAIDGRANRAARIFLAESLGVRASAVRLVAGEKSRHKKFEIVGLEPRRGRQMLDDLVAVPQ